MTTKTYVVSAFTANGKGGNRAGVVLDTGELSADQMQAIAAELGYSETAFVSGSLRVLWGSLRDCCCCLSGNR